MIRVLRLVSAPLLCLAVACGSNAPAPRGCGASESICLPPGAGSAFCANLKTDPNNCGGCGNSCGAVTGGTATCKAGLCTFDCGGGAGSTKVVCGSKSTGGDGGVVPYCTDLASDHENCGACGAVCPGNQQCQAGQCANLGTSACSGSGTGTNYVNLQSDRANCGACGVACAANEVCNAGSCDACPVAQCSNVCTDTQNDPLNCGACGSTAAFCEAGTHLSKITLEVLPPSSLGLISAAGTSAPVAVKVHSQLQAVQVTVRVSGAAPSALSVQAPTDVSPTVWTGSVAVPNATTVTLTFDAYDELYLPGAPDAAQHMDEKSVALNVLTAPTAAANTPQAFAGTVPIGSPDSRGRIFRWVPLNAGPLTFSATLSSSNPSVTTMAFRTGAGVFGTAPLAANGVATLTVQPADVGLGDVAVSACPLDAVGQQGPCSGAVTFNVGRINVGGSAPVLGKNVDASNSHTIYYVAGNQQLLAQDFSQLNTTTSGEPGQPVSGDLFYADTLVATAEGTGTYAIKNDGSQVQRIECPTCIKTRFVIPPAGVSLRNFEQTGSGAVAVTGAAMLLADNASTPLGYFAQARPAQASDNAIAMGVPVGNGNSPRGGLFSSQAHVFSTRSGALVAWFNNNGDVRPWIFHPSLPGNHALPLMGVRAGTVARDLIVYPGGEIVFLFTDSNNTYYVGAAFFDGVNVPGLLAPVQSGPAGSGNAPGGFVLARPRVVLGLESGSSSGLQTLEINLLGTPALFRPAPFNGVTAGSVVQYGVTQRLGNQGTFAVSDDQTKAIFVTQDPQPNNIDTFRLHLLDLATGADTPVFASPTLGSNQNQGVRARGASEALVLDLPPGFGPRVGRLPHFVTSAGSVTGGTPSGANQFVVYAETLPTANYQQLTSHERIGFASWQGSAVQVASIDRLNSFSAVNSETESAAGAVILFLSENKAGGADLYSVPLKPTSGPVVATKLVDRVFWFTTREDTARLLVMRSDGVMLSARLTPGANLQQTLAPVMDGCAGGDAPLSSRNELNTFGFTPDGNHGYALQGPSIDESRFVRGILETIDLDTGARQDFGRVVGSRYNFSRSPEAGFVGNAGTALVVAPISVENLKIQLAVAPPGATTSRVNTLALAGGAEPNGNAMSGFRSSLDGSEGFLQYPGAQSVQLFKDGSFLRVPNGDVPFGGPGVNSTSLQQRATFSPFAPYLPDWSQVNATVNGLPGSLFKIWGGTGVSPFVTVSRGFTAQESLNQTVITPDFKELLYSFNDSNAAYGFVFALALPGRTPPTAPAP